MSAPPKKQPVVFGKYLLLDRINIGGMAEVWRGKTFGAGGFERLVAIKRILPNIAEDDEFKTMFIDEAKISVQLTHANIAQVHDLGQIGNSLFIAMEYIPGKDLRSIFDRCRKKGEPAPIPLTCYVISKLCDALDYAHRKKDGMGRDMNIVHRDVSPQNVLISFDGEVKVIDFGIAKAAGKATKTQAGILKGKFGYMSPEQIRGLPLDRRSDVFAIGICLYELLTGERLFVGDSDFSVLEKVRRAEVLAPSTYNRRVPDNLERVVMRALAKDVDTRYQYSSELFKDLQPFTITPDVFTQRDLAQYMKSTFAEDVEREKARLLEYADIKPPTPSSAPMMPSVSSPSLQMVNATADALFQRGQQLAAATASQPPGLDAGAAVGATLRPGSGSGGRLSTLNGHPKLTPANVVTPQERDAATQLVPSPARMGRGPDTDPTFHNAENTDADPYNFGIDTEPPGTPAPVGALEPEPATKADRPPGGVLKRINSPVASPLVALPAAMTPTVPATPSVMRIAARGRDSVPTEPPGSPAVPPAHGAPALSPPRRPTLQGSVQGAHPLLLDRPVVEVNRPPPHAAPVAPRSPAAGPAGGRLRWLAAVALGLALVLAGAVGGYLLRAGARGFVLIELAPRFSGRARLFINGHDYGKPESWPVLQPVPAGVAAVKILVDGHTPFAQTVDVKEGRIPSVLQVDLIPSVEQGMLVVVTDPETSELKLNGRVVKAEGSGGFQPIPVPVGAEQLVTASRRGFGQVQRRVTPTRSDEPLIIFLKLDPSEFWVVMTSEPSGATIHDGERLLGVTPARIHVTPDLSQVLLRHRCYAPAPLMIRPPSEPNEVPRLNAVLVRQAGCR